MIDNPIVWHKEMNTYIEGNVVYIELNTGNMVGEGVGGSIIVHVVPHSEQRNIYRL